jgi:hypothetical protein
MKKVYTIILILIFAMSLSSAYANDITNSSDENPVIDSDSDDSVSNDYKNFTELNEEIDNSEDTINLTCNYNYESSDSTVNLNKSITIDGQNNTINVKEQPSAFTMNESNVDIVFKNLIIEESNNRTFDVNAENISVTFNDVVFMPKSEEPIQIEIEEEPEEPLTYSGEIHIQIKQLAESIVGESKGIEAAKKIAVWVKNNIKHETRAGFYQSPMKTLKRKAGNCCCHTDLFIQMCDAVGLTEKHEICYVHTGRLTFGYRHFFATFDGVCVDTDGDVINPWGHAVISGRGIYNIIKYPVLPLPRAY